MADLQRKSYVIQRESETRNEWWTGAGWTENESAAATFDEELFPGLVTGDESAKAVVRQSPFPQKPV